MRIESTKMLDIEHVLRKRSKLLRRNMLLFWIRMLRQHVLQLEHGECINGACRMTHKSFGLQCFR
jgi:hypothetical protein